jgi:PKD repeat protein
MKISVLSVVLAALSPAACGSNAIDGPPPDVSLRASVLEGKAPLQVTLSIDCKETSAYTIDRFEWDFDADGVVDLTTRPLGGGEVTANTLAAESYEYTQAGKYSPKAQVLFKQNDAGSWAYLDLHKLSTGEFSHDLVVSP